MTLYEIADLIDAEAAKCAKSDAARSQKLTTLADALRAVAARYDGPKAA